MSSKEPRKINQKRLVKIFKDIKRLDSEEIRFCFLLGAGSSFSSGIPTGWKLANDWYRELESDLDENEFTSWKESIDFDEERIAEFYPHLYKKRYESSPQVGYEEFKKLMDNKEPSIGYVILSQILAKEKHNFVITTNFDYLVEDAVRMYTDTKPFSAGHEILADFISDQTERPTIIKVHRDLFLNPFNSEENTETLKDEWKKALRPILKNFNLLAVGYGGNDGSLMDYLKEIDSTERKPIYWCKRIKDTLNEKVTSLLSGNDYIVEIEDFDELMYALHNSLEYETFKDIESSENHPFVKNARKRINDLNIKLNDIVQKLSEKELSEERAESYESLFKGATDVIFKAQVEKDLEKKNKIYTDGLKEYPNNAALLGSYAVFLNDNKKDFDKAEEFYLKAIDADPTHANTLGNYALFLKNIHKDFDKAEEFYLKAIETNSTGATTLGNYANFLTNIRRDFDKAEEFYLKAIQADPTNATNLGNYALFLHERKDFDKAEEFYLKAIEANPSDANTMGNYAHTLIINKNKFIDANIYIEKAIQKKPTKKPLLSELWFYRFAHYRKYLEQGKRELTKLIKEGVKSIGWDLQSHVDLAIKNDHPEPEKLQEFADAITKPD